MYDELKRKCTGAGPSLKATSESLKKLALFSAIVILLIGIVVAFTTGLYYTLVSYIFGAFADLVGLYIFALILDAIGDVSINTEVSARVACDEHDGKIVAKKISIINDETPPIVIQQGAEVASEPEKKEEENNGAFKPFAPVKDTPKKPAAPVKKEAPVVKEEPKKEPVKSEPVKSQPARQERPAPAASRGVGRGEGSSLRQSSLSSGSTGEKLPSSYAADEEEVKAPVNKSFVPFPAAPGVNSTEEAPSPFKPIETKKTSAPKAEEKTEAPAAASSSPFTPFPSAPAPKDEAPSPFKPLASNAKKEEPAEAAPSQANSPFSPFAAPAQAKPAEASSPFKAMMPAEEPEEAGPIKINKLHKCPHCEVMINTNPCPRCGYEITAEELAGNNSSAQASKPVVPKSGINKLHKCSECGRITKTSPCEHCGAE